MSGAANRPVSKCKALGEFGNKPKAQLSANDAGIASGTGPGIPHASATKASARGKAAVPSPLSQAFHGWSVKPGPPGDSNKTSRRVT